jgi:flagellum-specific peptidoglycan hydrolase FlgJ
LPSQSDAPEPLYAKRTPLSEQAVAAYLAQAWQAVIGEPIQHGTLAVLWAHSALETGRGEKMLGFNFAGLKGQAPNGDGRPLLTWEHGADGPKRVRRTFRVYRSAEQGARDYIELLKNKYSRARRAAERGSPVDFVSGLAENDYFTHDAEQYTRSVTLLTLEYLKKHPEAPDSSESSVGALAAR